MVDNIKKILKLENPKTLRFKRSLLFLKYKINHILEIKIIKGNSFIIILGIYRAVRSGVGIGALPDYFTEGSPNLVHILPELQAPQTDVYFVYPEELRQSARIAVFRDFLLTKILENRKLKV